MTAPFVSSAATARRSPDDTADRLDDVAVTRTTGDLSRRLRATPTTRRGRPPASRPPRHARRSISACTAGDLRAVHGDTVAVSHVFAETGHLQARRHVRRAAGRHDPPRRSRVGAIYTRAAGLGDVVLADAPAPIDAIFVQRPRSTRHAAPALEVLTRAEYRTRVHAAGHETGVGRLDDHRPRRAVRHARADQHRADGDRPSAAPSWPRSACSAAPRGHVLRTAVLETLPTTLVALAAGAAVVAVSVHGVPLGLTGIPLASR